MKLNPLTLLLLALASVATSPTQAANLIINGSFEDPVISGSYASFLPGATALTGWTIPGPFVTIIHHSPDAGSANGYSTYNFAKSGDNYLDLSGTGNQSAIYQDFATIPSAAYNLSFYIGASAETLPAATIGVDLVGSISLFHLTLTPSAPSTNINWTLQSLNFVANSTTTRLSLKGLSGFDDNASFVDNISVSQIPEPSSALTLSLAGLTLLRRRRA